MDNNSLLTTGQLVVYETVFHNNRPHLGLLLLCYKFIKLQNRNNNVEKLRLLTFGLIWFFLKKCDNIILGYLFTDDAYTAAFYGLLTPHLTYIGNILYVLLLQAVAENPRTSITEELNNFVEGGLIKMLGFE